MDTGLVKCGAPLTQWRKGVGRGREEEGRKEMARRGGERRRGGRGEEGEEKGGKSSEKGHTKNEFQIEANVVTSGIPLPHDDPTSPT